MKKQTDLTGILNEVKIGHLGHIKTEMTQVTLVDYRAKRLKFDDPAQMTLQMRSPIALQPRKEPLTSPRGLLKVRLLAFDRLGQFNIIEDIIDPENFDIELTQSTDDKGNVTFFVFKIKEIQ